MSLLDDVRDLLAAGIEAYRDRPAHQRLRDAEAHLDAPLHLAVAGLPGSGRRCVLTALSTDPALVARPADRPGPADAVLYVFRETYPSGMASARMLADLARSGAGPLRTLGVLTAVDLAGGGERTDVLPGHATLGAMAAEVVPLTGLVAAASATLGGAEYDMLTHLATESPAVTGPLLLSAQRFAQHSGAALLPWLGLWGVRTALRLLRDDDARGPDELGAALAAESGLNRLRETLDHRFRDRLPVLRADRALRLIAEVTRDYPVPAGAGLRRHAERIRCDTHEFAECDALTAGALPERLYRVLGGRGTSVAARIGDGDPGAEHDHWQRVAGNPLTAPAVARAATVAVRTCEIVSAGDES